MRFILHDPLVILPDREDAQTVFEGVNFVVAQEQPLQSGQSVQVHHLRQRREAGALRGPFSKVGQFGVPHFQPVQASAAGSFGWVAKWWTGEVNERRLRLWENAHVDTSA